MASLPLFPTYVEKVEEPGVHLIRSMYYIILDFIYCLSFVLQILVAPQKRKQLQLYALSGEKMVHLKDYNIPEPALQMVIGLSFDLDAGML